MRIHYRHTTFHNWNLAQLIRIFSIFVLGPTSSLAPQGLPWWLRGLKSLPAMRQTWVRSLGWDDLWRRKWNPTPVFLPGKSHEWKSLVGYSPWGHKELDTTERLHFTSSLLAYLDALQAFISEARVVLFSDPLGNTQDKRWM